MTLNWWTRDSRDGDIFNAAIGGLKITVQDCDGDRSRWWIRQAEDGVEIASGESCALTPDHTDHAKAVAEEAARVVLRFRKRAEAGG